MKKIIVAVLALLPLSLIVADTPVMPTAQKYDQAVLNKCLDAISYTHTKNLEGKITPFNAEQLINGLPEAEKAKFQACLARETTAEQKTAEDVTAQAA